MRNALLSVVVLLLAACTDETEAPPLVADIDAGRAMARAHCADCHGMDGRGEKARIPNLAAQPAGYLVDALSAYRDGRRQHESLQEMAAGMSDADIVNIAGYYSSLPPLQVIASSPAAQATGSSYAEGQDVAAICVDCHGENGDSLEPGIPSLAGQQPAYLILSTLEYVNGSRGHAEKETMLKGLKQVDIEKMAMYFAAQIPAVRVPPPFGDPQRGEPLSASCGDCHGARGISEDPLVPSLAGQEPVYLVNAIKSYRDNQRHHEDMVVDSSDSEIEDIAAYYSVQQAAAAADDDAQATRELVAKCDRCHGPATGKSRMVVPSLNGQNREYLMGVMKAYRDNDRGSSMMHKMSANYSDETIEALASYYTNHAAE
ncbi:MAG TPA: c-type cytochrome [Xanthomonadales bacterium]|nr:c-type cytochrome [Xanthomonadales bacterium]